MYLEGNSGFTKGTYFLKQIAHGKKQNPKCTCLIPSVYVYKPLCWLCAHENFLQQNRSLRQNVRLPYNLDADGDPIMFEREGGFKICINDTEQTQGSEFALE